MTDTVDSVRPLRIAFHVGLVVTSVVALAMVGVQIFGDRTGKWEAVRTSLPFAYVAIGVVHVLVLRGLAQRVPVERRLLLADWLYTAGFIHTLVSLGVTLAIAGALLSAPEGDSSVATLIPPMAASVLPHALAVWLGHALSSGPEAPISLEEAIIKALADDSQAARQSLSRLYTDRQAALSQEVALLHQHLATMKGLRTETLRLVAAAQGEITAIGDSASQMNVTLQQPTTQIAGAFTKAATDVSKAATAADKLRTSVNDAAEGFEGFRNEVEKATEVVGQLKVLQESIVELLSSRVFMDASQP